jgi:hypothetical protein
VQFPIKYLGLPLSTRRLRKVDFQPQIDKATAKLSKWRGRNLTQARRVCLTKAVLSSQPVYLLTVIKPPKEVLEEVDMIRRRFLLAGDKAISGGKCKVKWTKTTSPKEYGGLGVLDLDKFATALRLRWLWHEWTSTDNPWVGMETPCTESDKVFFSRCTSISLGNGRKADFWNSAWLLGQRPKDLAPLLYNFTRRKKRSVAEALRDSTWIRDLNYRTGFTTSLLLQFVVLWNLLAPVQLNANLEDTISWTLTRHGEYTAASAYKAQFVGLTKTPALASIWPTWAPPKCKLFAWLFLQNRVWTSDRLARRNWDHSPSCPLCRRTMETSLHMVCECCYTRRIWATAAAWTGLRHLHPDEWPQNESVLQWWSSVTALPDIPRKGVRSFVLLVLWEVWLEKKR